MQYSFGSGILYGRSLTNTPATPVRFGALQGVSLEFAFTTKELYGQYQFPIALGRGTGKITGKADFAQFNAQTFNDLFFGLSNPATGSTRTSVAEAQTITANAVTVTQSANFVADMGVVLAGTARSTPASHRARPACSTPATSRPACTASTARRTTCRCW